MNVVDTAVWNAELGVYNLSIIDTRWIAHYYVRSNLVGSRIANLRINNQVYRPILRTVRPGFMVEVYKLHAGNYTIGWSRAVDGIAYLHTLTNSGISKLLYTRLTLDNGFKSVFNPAI